MRKNTKLAAHQATKYTAGMEAFEPVIVAIDGPAGAGKSTVAREVARRLQFALVDTGAIYRAVAYLALRGHVALDDEAGLGPLVDGLDIAFALSEDNNRVTLAGVDVTDALRQTNVTRAAAQISVLPRVRSGLLGLQRRLAGSHHAVLEGRDIGTVVCPHAQIKVFLHASLQERARRRFEEMSARGEDVLLDDVIRDVEERDASDRLREHGPLKAADDAMLLDSTKLSVEQVIDEIVGRVGAAFPQVGPQPSKQAQ